MNDEIREILDNIKRQNEWDGIEYFKTPLSTKDANKLLDYITNLQKENERLKEENKCIFSKVNDDELLISNAMNYAEAQDYKSRVEKAVEFINENVSVYAFNNKELPHWEFDDDNINDLLNILQNGSDASVKD